MVGFAEAREGGGDEGQGGAANARGWPTREHEQLSWGWVGGKKATLGMDGL